MCLLIGHAPCFNKLMEECVLGSFEQSHQLRVQYHETDQMGVVHHSNYIRWFESGRTEMIRKAGISYREMEDLGLLLPVVDVQVKYHKPARYDELITIYTSIAKLTPVVMEFDYDVYRSEDDELLVSGKTSHIWINENWRPTRLHRRAPEVYEHLRSLLET